MISCPYLNNGGVMFFVNNVVMHCCASKEVDGKFTAPPFIGKCKDAGELDVEQFIDMAYQAKVDMIDKLNNNIECHCSGCSELVEKNWTPLSRENFKIKRLAIAPSEICNASCSYCMQNHANKTTYDVYGILNKLIDAKYLDVNDVDWLVWGGGEPTIMANFDELYSLFAHSKENILHTSAIRYSKAVEDAISKSDSLEVLTSLDAGTPATFQKIKKVDQFNTVIKNIKQYYDKISKKSNICIKYILLEDVNSSFDEIDSFFETIKANGLNDVTIYVSLNITAPITDKIVIALLYFNARSISVLGKSAKDHGMISTRLPFEYQKITI